jgi:hypothetical protein
MKKAVMVAVLAITLCDFLSFPSIIPMKMGMLAMGFIMAKKPVNTVNAKVSSVSSIFYSYSIL